MIPFIRLPLRSPREENKRPEIRPVLVAIILGLILCFEVGLVLWVFYHQWRT